MKRPKINKPYVFVRVVDGRVEHAEFMRGDGGNVCWVHEGMIGGGQEDPDAWKQMMQYFAENGYIELAEAKKLNLIPSDWAPTETLLNDWRRTTK